MIKQKYKQDFLRAGALAKEVRSYGKSLIVKGASYNDVIAKIHQKIIDLGAIAAFPPQIALNDVAAHYLPQPGQDILFSHQIIKLDIGICYHGAIGDCAATLDLSGKHQGLIDAAEAALLKAEQSIHVGQLVRDIGKIIEETIASHGFNAVKNLGGHGLGMYKVHTPPTIPNYHDRSTAVIKPGMTFAIEPFATNGKGLIYESGEPMIFSLLKEHPAPSEISRALLTTIKTFNGLPFAIHDLISPEMPYFKVKLALTELLRANIILGYGPLIEEAHGMVAQAENSVLIDENGQVFITTR